MWQAIATVAGSNGPLYFRRWRFSRFRRNAGGVVRPPASLALAAVSRSVSCLRRPTSHIQPTLYSRGLQRACLLSVRDRVAAGVALIESLNKRT